MFGHSRMEQELIFLAAKWIRLTLAASLVAAAASGCANARHESTGTNDGAHVNQYRAASDKYGNMRLGLDRYQGVDPGTFRDSDDLRHGLNRDSGLTGIGQDGVNRWSDYKDRNGNPATVPGQPGGAAPMEAAQDVANGLTAIDPVHSANVLLMGNNAYVGVTTKSGQSLDDAGDTKTKIAEQVKTKRPNVQNVYVSANPDFVGSVNRYAQDLNAGKPITGLGEEFNSMVRRLFPTNAANPNTAK